MVVVGININRTMPGTRQVLCKGEDYHYYCDDYHQNSSHEAEGAGADDSTGQLEKARGLGQPQEPGQWTRQGSASKESVAERPCHISYLVGEIGTEM